MMAMGKTVAEMALSLALEEQARGVFENPPHSNRGDRIDEYQEGRSSLGQAWCLKFVHWCFTQAAARLGQKNPLPKIYAVQPFLLWAYRERKVVPSPLPGDVLIKKPAKHVGLVLTALERGAFTSVEGNTYTADKEKEGVYIVRRLSAINYLFVRL
jgi:hypothetical protein